MTDVPPPPMEYEVPRQLALADAAAKPIRRAIAYARFDAWSLAVFAVASLLCVGGSGTDVAVAVLVAATLATVAAVEFVAVHRLRKLDPSAVRLLTRNQLALAAAILAYCGWNLYLTAHDRGLMAALLQQLAGQADAQTTDVARRAIYALYAGLAVIGPAWTIGTAWYYATRAKPLAAYLAQTPPWVLQVHRDRGTV